MSWKSNGAAAIISSDYPLAMCASHTLNLAVIKSLDVQCVRNMIGIVNKVSTFFFAHPKWQRKLEEAIQTTQPTFSVLKLKDLCRTRWIEQIDALARFKNLHPSCISAEGSTNWTSDSLTDVSTLLLAITTTDFLSALVIVNKCLNYLHVVCRQRQRILLRQSQKSTILRMFWLMYVRMLIPIMVSGLWKWRRCVTLLEYNLHFPACVAANVIASMFQLKIRLNIIDAQLQFQYWITFCQR